MMMMIMMMMMVMTYFDIWGYDVDSDDDNVLMI